MDDLNLTLPETTDAQASQELPMPLDASTADAIRETPEAIPADVVETPVEAAAAVFSESATKPFSILLHLTPQGKPNHFIPRATLEIDPSLRTSGLLAALPADEVKTLVALLTFLSPNGDVKPTAPEVAKGLNVSESKAKDLLSRLVRFRWQSKPLVTTLWRETGMDGYALSREIVRYIEASPVPRFASAPPYKTAGREAIIAASRAKYARPRADVERQIALLNGWELPEGETGAGVGAPEDYLRQRLMKLGVTAEQSELLLASFPAEEIERQIAWLPYRGAKNPASYLVAAITGNYEEPGLLRMRREQQPLYRTVQTEHDEPDRPESNFPPESVNGQR